MTLTPAQQKALDWLPSDGSWIGLDGDRQHTAGLSFLYQRKQPLVEYDGSIWERYRLTPKGIAYKAGRAA